ncbi:MAG: Dabb family protein [Syntrophobacteraceae bacterium]
MLKHVVFMKFKPEATEDAIQDLEESLAALPGAIPEIKQYEFGRDVLHTERSYDFALVSAFENLDALKRYQVHPDHVVVLNKVRALVESILAVDFELS